MADLSSKTVAEANLSSLCVGREAEIARIRSLYQKTASGSAHTLLIDGPSGVGKSRLLHELKRRCRLDGIGVLEGRCRPDRVAYQPFLDIVREASSYLADIEPALFQASRTVEILEALSGRNGSPDPERFDRWEDRRIALYESVGSLLTSVSRVRPPVVLIHNLQFADDASLSLLGHLLSTLSEAAELRQPGQAAFNGLFVLSERTGDEGRSCLNGHLSGVSSSRLSLQGLDRAGVEAFLSSPRVVDRFVEATGGNPRQIEALLDRRVRDADSLLLERIASLPPTAQRVVSTLAVFGRPSAPRTLGRLAEVEGRELGSAVDHLIRSKVLHSSVREGELKLSFKSTSDQEAVLSELKVDQRERLHRRIGEEMLARGDDVSAAEHLLTGKATQQAAEVVLRAGERLEIAFAYERAIDLYERAASDTLDEELKEQLEERLCELFELIGEYDRAVALAEGLEQLHPEDPRLQQRIGHLHLQRGDFSRARAQLEGALALLDKNGPDPAERVLLLSDLAEIYHLQGERQGAEETVERVLDAVDGNEPLPLLKARNTLGKIHLERGDFEQAAELFSQNLQESRAANVVPEEIRSLINLGISHLRRGRYAEAARCYRDGLSAAEESHDYRHRAFCLQNLGVLAHWRRDYTSTLQLFHDATQAFLRLGHKSWLSWLALDLGDLYLELGLPDRAEAMMELATSLVDAQDDSQTPLFTRMLQGRLAAFHGDHATALDHYAAARERAEAAGKSDEVAIAAIELARLALREGRSSEAEALATEHCESPTLKTRANAWAVTGEALLHRGTDLQTAQQALVKARSLFEQAGDPLGLWSVLARLAEVHEQQQDTLRANRLRQQAVKIEGRIRKTVPKEFVEAYLSHPDRRSLLRGIGAVEPPVVDEAEPTPAAANGKSPRSARRRKVAGRTEEHAQRYSAIIGEHPNLLAVLDIIDKIATLDSTVLIRGESGTGKELIAEAIHQQSRRRERPLVKVNCGALVESLLLSELFGHERGAFTGASRRKKGRFEVASGGTIFLDEIGDISPKTQVALLRVLQEKEFERVGGNSPIRANVRIVCATNRDLEAMVRDGTFREDLYYRLKAIQVEIPALRDRPSDIETLANFFLQRMARDGECERMELSKGAAELLTAWRWPGNVRELENVLRSVSLLSDGERIDPSDLVDFIPIDECVIATPGVAEEPTPTIAEDPEEFEEQTPESAEPYSDMVREGMSLHEYKKKIEEQCIASALKKTNGNITRAAALLKMKRPRLSQLVKEYGLSG